MMRFTMRFTRLTVFETPFFDTAFVCPSAAFFFVGFQLRRASLFVRDYFDERFRCFLRTHGGAMLMMFEKTPFDTPRRPALTSPRSTPFVI